MTEFDEKYYNSVNYDNYMERGAKYIQTARDLLHILRYLNLDKEPFLDFGCAVGFLMDGIKKERYDVVGVDISDWALSKARERGHLVSKEIDFTQKYGVTFALDVFEHMNEDDLVNTFEQLNSKTIAFRMPVCREGEDDFVLECSRADPTHVIKWSANDWNQWFRYYGYHVLELNTPTIYTSEGVYAGLAIR